MSANGQSAKSVLLRALEQIEEIEDANDGRVEHLVVCWVVDSDEAWNTGFASTSAPPFMNAALLEYTAGIIHSAFRQVGGDE